LSDDKISACNFFPPALFLAGASGNARRSMLKNDKDGSGTLDWDEFKVVALKVTHFLSLSESGKQSELMRRQ
jgi:hypothetical protein